MSIDDGLVMQLHPGVVPQSQPRRCSSAFGARQGRRHPRRRTDYVRALKPLLDRFGNDRRLSPDPLHARRDRLLARARAAGRPLSGPEARSLLVVLRQPGGHAPYRERVTETAGFYNTVGFNDDTRAFLSIPARHDVARRVDCGFLAELVPIIVSTRTRPASWPSISRTSWPSAPTSWSGRSEPPFSSFQIGQATDLAEARSLWLEDGAPTLRLAGF